MDVGKAVANLQITGSIMCFECGNIIGNADVIQGHKLSCRLGEQLGGPMEPSGTYFPPQLKREQCGRCWQNHTPGFVCACECHIKLQLHPVDIPWDNGDDLDAPRNKDVPKKPWC